MKEILIEHIWKNYYLKHFNNSMCKDHDMFPANYSHYAITRGTLFDIGIDNSYCHLDFKWESNFENLISLATH